MFNVGPEELLLILLIALIVFGPKRLPEIGRTIGKALREFRRASEGVREEVRRHLELEDEDDGFTGTYPLEPVTRSPDGDAGPTVAYTPSESELTKSELTKSENGHLPEARSGPAA